MKKACFFIMLLVFSSTLAYADLTDVIKGLGNTQKGGADENTTASGLKEALSIGTENAVKNVSRAGGYFGNQAIKILMPEKIQKVADVLRKIGYQKQVERVCAEHEQCSREGGTQGSVFFC